MAWQAALAAQPTVAHANHLTLTHLGFGPGVARPRRFIEGGLHQAARPLPGIQRVPHSAHYGGVLRAGPHDLLAASDVRGSLDIWAPRPLVIFDTRIIAGPGHWGVHVRPGAGPVLMVGCEIVAGPGDGPSSVGLFARGDDCAVVRSRIAGFSDGARISGAQVAVVECLIGDLAHRAGDHNDGVQIEAAGRQVTVVRSRIVNRHRQTSALKNAGRDVRIVDCRLAGGGWTLYGGARDGALAVHVSGTVFARDVFAKVGWFGAATDWPTAAASQSLWRDNVRDDGRPIRP